MPSEARKHADDALDHWQSGRFGEAESLYRLAIQEGASEPDHELSSFHTQLGQVLASLGNDSEAEIELRRAIEIARNSKDDSSNIVAIARYFCAEFYVSRDQSAEALAILAPSLVVPCSIAAVLHFVEAKALWALGRRQDARAAAAMSLSLSQSEEQRERLQARFRELPDWTESD